jgi:hypothetical protein
VTVTPPQERSSSPRPAKPFPQARERANEGPCAPLRRSPDEDRGCATAPGDDAEAAAERELLRLCFVHAKDAAWAQWFHECVWLGHDSKVEALAFYRAWEATQRQGGAA